MADILVPVTAKVITVADSNLFRIAADYLGDATKWNYISDLNPQLAGDPYFDGTVTLVLPPSNQPTNGGLIAR